MVLNISKKYQSGMSLAEALMAVVISTIVMGTAYFIYNKFQQTFVRQLNHSVIKQEVRFAIHSLQLDLKIAGYRHIDASTEITDANAIRLFDTSNNAVTDGNDADRVSACFDHENNDGTIQRKIVEYEIGTEQSGDEHLNRGVPIIKPRFIAVILHLDLDLIRQARAGNPINRVIMLLARDG